MGVKKSKRCTGQKNDMRRESTAVLDCCILVWALAFGPICWVLRDGLGPGMVCSQGINAIARFLQTFNWGLIFVVLLAMRFILVRKAAGRRKDVPDPTSMSDHDK